MTRSSYTSTSSEEDFRTKQQQKGQSMAGFDLDTWELACYCFIFIVGLLGNLTVCLVVLKSGSASRRFRQVPFNIYLMSLAIADLTLAIVCLPVYLTSTSHFPHPAGTNGDVFCKIISGYLLPFWLGTVSIYTLVIISFERHTAICKPFLAVTRTASIKTAVYVASVWCIGFIIQIPTIIGLDYTASDPTIGNYCRYTWKTETTSTSIYGFVFTFQYVVPAVIFLVNFYRIQKCLRKMDRNLKGSLGDAQQLVKLMKGKKKTVRIVFVVSAAFFICWTPTSIMYFLFQYGGQTEVSWSSDIYQVGVVLGFFNSCINPFLYAFQSRDFRSHCKKVLGQMTGIKFCGRQSSSNAGTTSSQSKIKFRPLSAAQSSKTSSSQNKPSFKQM